MKKLILMFTLLFVAIIFNSCSGLQPSVKELDTWKKECNQIKKEKSQYNFVFAEGECLNYSISKGMNNDKINILIHGSWPKGMDPLSILFDEIAENLTKNTEITSIAIATPGYSESTSNRYSELSWGNNRIIPAEEEFIKIIAKAIEELKIKYKAKEVNLYGKSSGAMIGGIISGYKPGLIDRYILIGGSYDPYYTYKYNGWGTLGYGHLTSVQYIPNVDKNAKFLLIAGEKDDKAPPIFAKQYKEQLNKAGINAEVVIIKDAKHSQLERNSEVLDVSYKFLTN
jgi:predicted esterase